MGAESSPFNGVGIGPGMNATALPVQRGRGDELPAGERLRKPTNEPHLVNVDKVPLRL